MLEIFFSPILHIYFMSCIINNDAVGFSSVFTKKIFVNKVTLLKFTILIKFDYLIGANTIQIYI